MIVEIGFGLEAKIPNLTVSRIKMPCDCKIIKLEKENPDYDALVDLCPKHEEKYKKMQSGEMESEVLIPGLQVERE